MSNLSAISKTSAVDEATTALRRVMLDGEFAVGARLPPERSLAETLGVHRATLRCALARLEAEGLVRARHGSGYEVLDFLKTSTAALLGPLLDRPSTPPVRLLQARDLLLMRRHLAAALFERLSTVPDLDLCGVDDAIAHLATKLSASVEDFAAADLAVVSALLDATKSEVLSLCLHPVSTVLLGWPALMRAMYRHPEANVERWRAVRAWLAAPAMVSASQLADALSTFDEDTLARLEAELCALDATRAS